MKLTGYFFYAVLLAAFFLLIGARCTRDIQPFGYGADTEAAISLTESSAAKSTLFNDKFKECAAGEFVFACPDGWTVRYESGNGVGHIIVTNTEKQIVRGAVLPDDYFEPHGDAIAPNVGKYALEYVLIAIDVYEDEAGDDWAAAVQRIYHGGVTDFEPYQVPYQEGVAAIRPTQWQSVVDGAPRFLARSGGYLYDAGLYFVGADEDAANVWFNEFLRRFPF